MNRADLPSCAHFCIKITSIHFHFVLSEIHWRQSLGWMPRRCHGDQRSRVDFSRIRNLYDLSLEVHSCFVVSLFDLKGEEFAFSNFGLKWNKSVYALASSGRIDKYSSIPPMHWSISTFTNLFKRHSYSHLPDPDLHSYGMVNPVHRSEIDVLFLRRSASFVKRPSLCWNYDSPSGMRCRGALVAPLCPAGGQ